MTGDSSGANICLSMLQIILELCRLQKRSCPIVKWNGREVQLPKPAGIATMSAYTDLSRGLPSWRSEEEYDIFRRDLPLQLTAEFPACSAWPSDPPRGDIYCDLSALCHPLVSPTAATDWTGSPPMLIVCGEERASDSNKVIAQRAQSQGVRVVWEQYEAMPHTFMTLLDRTAHPALCFEHWAEFCRTVVANPDNVETSGHLIRVGTLRSTAVDVGHLTELTVEDALSMMHAQAATRRVWAGPEVNKSHL